ncbi:hypothetical protein ADK43_16395, partial [Streptomyces rimosus subsp. rimosus]
MTAAGDLLVRAIAAGTGPIGPVAGEADALAGIGVDARLLDYTEHTMSEGASAVAASYIECAIDGRVLWGIGIDANTTRASLWAPPAEEVKVGLQILESLNLRPRRLEIVSC